MSRIGLGLATIAMITCTGFTVSAQDREVTQQQPKEAIGQDQATNQDREKEGKGDQKSVSVKELIVKKLKHANKCEIELAKMAQEKVENPELQKFTSTLIRDHEAMLQKLDEKWGDKQGNRENAAQPGQGGVDVSVERGEGVQVRTGSQQEGQQGQGQPGQRGQLLAGSMSQQVPAELCAIMEQAGENMKEMNKKMLMEYKGQDFQMAFLGQQIVAHMAMIAELKAIQSTTDYEDLQPIVDEALKGTQEHLETAKSLAQKFEDDSKQSGDRRVEAPGKPERR